MPDMSGGALARPADRSRQKMIEINRALKDKASSMALMLPKGEGDEDRMRAVVLTCIQKSPKLLDCSTASILGCVYEAAKVGLVPGFGCHIIPRKNRGQMEATFQIDFTGAMDLARRDSVVKQIWSDVIRLEDDWAAPGGSSMQLRHNIARESGRPLSDKERGDIIAAYACARFADGFVQVEMVYQSDIDRAKKTAHIYSDSPWNNHEGAMWRKTAVKRLCKYLPKLPNAVRRAVQLDDMAEAGIPQEVGRAWQATPDDDGAIVTDGARELDVGDDPDGVFDVYGASDEGSAQS